MIQKIILNKGEPHGYRREARIVESGSVPGIMFLQAQMYRGEMRELTFGNPGDDRAFFLPLDEFRILLDALRGVV